MGSRGNNAENMGTHPIFESDFDCLTAFVRNNRKMLSRLILTNLRRANLRCASMQRGGVLQIPPSFSGNYDVGKKYMMGWFLTLTVFMLNIAYNEFGFLRRTGIAVEQCFEKRTSEPSGLTMTDGLARQKIAAQEAIWDAEDNVEEEDEDDE